MIRFEFSHQDWVDTDLAVALEAYARMKTNPAAGFLRAAVDATAWQRAADYGAQIAGQAKQVVVVGIGGSSLGAKVLTALPAAAGRPEILFFDNLDPDSVAGWAEGLGPLDQVHWLWISKSGTTLETLLHWQWAAQLYQSRGLDLAENSTVIAQEDRSGPLQDWARAQRVPTLPIPGDVSGRYSVFTAAGLVPAAIHGVDLKALRQGVDDALKAEKQLAEMMLATLASWQRREWITLVWTYGDRLRPLAQWLQQLWAESLAKSETRSGEGAPRVSFPVPCVGSLDQHSILQQVIEGARDKWLWLWTLDQHDRSGPPLRAGRTLAQAFAAQAEGTRRACGEVGVSTVSWYWPCFSSREVGAGLMFLQLLVAAMGEWLDIDAFNQPGVERGKTITQSLLGN